MTSEVTTNELQAIVSLPMPMERKLHSEACTEFKMQSDYFLRGYNSYW